MRFDAPLWLALLVLVPVLLVAYLLAQRRAAPGPRAGRHLTALALLLAVVGTVLALARPLLVVQPDVEEVAATVVVTLDVSNSMDATDVAPNRIEAAAESARSFVDALPPQFTVGLVLFGGSATLAVEPTRDHRAVLTELEGISLTSLQSGTAVGEAVFESLDAARTAPPPAAGAAPGPTRIVLLSDGASTNGRAVPEAAAAAKQAGVPVSTIAFGVTGDATEIDIPALEQLAADTGGQTYRAASGDELKSVYADIGSTLAGPVTETDLLVPALLGTLVAALLVALGGLVGLGRRPAAPAGGGHLHPGHPYPGHPGPGHLGPGRSGGAGHGGFGQSGPPPGGFPGPAPVESETVHFTASPEWADPDADHPAGGHRPTTPHGTGPGSWPGGPPGGHPQQGLPPAAVGGPPDTGRHRS